MDVLMGSDMMFGVGLSATLTVLVLGSWFVVLHGELLAATMLGAGVFMGVGILSVVNSILAMRSTQRDVPVRLPHKIGDNMWVWVQMPPTRPTWQEWVGLVHWTDYKWFALAGVFAFLAVVLPRSTRPLLDTV